MGAGVVVGMNTRAAALFALAASTALAIRAARSKRTLTATMAVVPWGILVDPDYSPRILRWAAIKRVHVEIFYGRDAGTATTLYSVVTIETEHERLSGCAAGAAPLDRLLAHLEPYTREQSHAIALDLDGDRPSEGPLEPECEPLLSSARAWIESAPASMRLELQASYRGVFGGASPRTAEVLRGVLRDRTGRAVDPRAFAAVIAAELGVREVIDDLLALVQSPHPVIAAVAKTAARKLGAATTRTGALEEVAPFLSERDYQVLAAWSGGR
jgi:hypothetical protein